MDTSGFYKRIKGKLVCSKDSVSNGTITMTRENRATYQFPADGWYWCDNLEQAQNMPTGNMDPRKITKLAFSSRFTDAEAMQIDVLSRGNDALAAALRRYQTKLELATFIDLNRQDTRNGVIALEQMGLLAPGRALQILDTITTLLEWAKE